MSNTRDKLGLENINNDVSVTRPSPPVHSPVELERPEDYPQKSRPKSALLFSNEPANALPESAKSFHVVEKVQYKGTLRFFKHNTPGSYMSELEAAAWSIYHLIAPGYVPEKVNAHYDSNGVFVGVSSKAIPGYIPALVKKLTDEDLNNPEIVKGNAIGTAMSYINEEEDYHTGNTDRNGMRIDFDMSIWPILGLFKEGKPIDWFYRTRDPSKFRMTANDINKFPDIADANPFYWPTKPQPFLREGTRQVLSKWVAISKNAFKSVENGVYKKLNKIDDFHYYKFRTFLKFLLLSDHMLGTAIKQHLRNDVTHTDARGKHHKVCDTLLRHLSDRKEQLRKTLVHMRTFQDFLASHGEKAMKEIRQEFADLNQHLIASEVRKWTKKPERSASTLINNMVDTDEVEKTYDDIFDEARQQAVKSMLNRKL